MNTLHFAFSLVKSGDISDVEIIEQMFLPLDEYTKRCYNTIIVYFMVYLTIILPLNPIRRE